MAILRDHVAGPVTVETVGHDPLVAGQSPDLIAAVEGFRLAGGFESMLAGDLVVAARDARFGLPEAKRGLAAMAGGLLRLPRLIPRRVAPEMALTGDHVDAERTHTHGLINRLVEPGEVLPEAVRMPRFHRAAGGGWGRGRNARGIQAAVARRPVRTSGGRRRQRRAPLRPWVPRPHGAVGCGRADRSGRRDRWPGRPGGDGRGPYRDRDILRL